jgi:outer membrane protein assembly factor BamB
MTMATVQRIVGSTLTLLAISGGAAGANWPQWRGPRGDGISGETGLPLHWSEHAGVIWKCPVPGQSASTPVVWGKSIFLTTQDAANLLLVKIDRDSGRVEWTRQVGTGTPARMMLRLKRPDERRRQNFHQLHNLASPSPVTDGERVIAHFGNGDLAAYDFAGRLLWRHNLQQDYGAYTIWWGHANSPVLYQDLVISACMQDSLEDLAGDRSPSYLVAHDKRTGEQRWKSLRLTPAHAEEFDAYTTPVFRTAAHATEMVVMGGNQLDAFDPLTGRQLWYLPGIVGGRTVTGPTVGRDLVFATQGKRGPFLAVRPEGEGKLPPAAVVWKQPQGTADSSSPIAWQDWVFWITDNGIAQCYDARTGVLQWKERLSGDYKASPVIAAGRMYFLSMSGLCTVLAAGPRFEKLAENKIDDETIASPALADGRIYLRGKKFLYAIGPQ